MKLFIIRGIPGSGKSTYVEEVLHPKFSNLVHIEADMYFYNKDGEYEFDPSKLSEAHEWCYETAKHELLGLEHPDMPSRKRNVAVANTFTQKWEMEKYLELATYEGVEVKVIRLENRFENIHGVPEEAIKKMQDRFEDYPGELITK